jgi:hypothetical protein
VAIVEGQQRMPAEGDHDRFLLERQHRGFRALGAGRQIGDRAALIPLGYGLLIDPVALARAIRLS